MTLWNTEYGDANEIKSRREDGNETRWKIKRKRVQRSEEGC